MQQGQSKEGGDHHRQMKLYSDLIVADLMAYIVFFDSFPSNYEPFHPMALINLYDYDDTIDNDIDDGDDSDINQLV